MLIGLGGGAASSVGSGQGQEDLDFASVQRGNPEMQRRCQEVIDACWALDERNPILSIHDVGAGGLSNALPELLNDGGHGGALELRRVPSGDTAMSPMEIWCNESQERYVLAIDPAGLAVFEAMCRRERCPYAVLGQATSRRQLMLADELLRAQPVDMPLDVLLGKPPKMSRVARRERLAGDELEASRDRPARGSASGSEISGSRQQVLPGDHRRPVGGRPGRPRSDGRTLAGAGRRRGRHAERFSRLQRGGHGHG